MTINMFPHQYEAQRRSAAEQEVIAERQRSEQRRETISKVIKKKTSVWDSLTGGASIGLIVGTVVCIGQCIGGMFDAGLESWFVCCLVGGAIGGLYALFANSSVDTTNKRASDEINAEQTNCDAAIQTIQNRATADIAAYRKKFFADAQSMSVRYAESKLAVEVINWISEGFARHVESADRASHIQQVVVPFTFNVYPNKISCVLGTYDFEIKRCATLTSPLQQAALARAIGTAVQLNTTMKYPKDPSGTAMTIKTSYKFAENYVCVELNYTAPNGNYRSVRSW